MTGGIGERLCRLADRGGIPAVQVVVGNDSFVQGVDLKPISLGGPMGNGSLSATKKRTAPAHRPTGGGLRPVRGLGDNASNPVMKADEPEGRPACVQGTSRGKPPRRTGTAFWKTSLVHFKSKSTNHDYHPLCHHDRNSRECAEKAAAARQSRPSGRDARSRPNIIPATSSNVTTSAPADQHLGRWRASGRRRKLVRLRERTWRGLHLAHLSYRDLCAGRRQLR